MSGCLPRKIALVLAYCLYFSVFVHSGSYAHSLESFLTIENISGGTGGDIGHDTAKDFFVSPLSRKKTRRVISAKPFAFLADHKEIARSLLVWSFSVPSTDTAFNRVALARSSLSTFGDEYKQDAFNGDGGYIVLEGSSSPVIKSKGFVCVAMAKYLILLQTGKKSVRYLALTPKTPMLHELGSFFMSFCDDWYSNLNQVSTHFFYSASVESCSCCARPTNIFSNKPSVNLRAVLPRGPTAILGTIWKDTGYDTGASLPMEDEIK